ncbi:hypothetical protein VPH184E373B_0142 [Vibrio phage 184E37-3b]
MIKCDQHHIQLKGSYLYLPYQLRQQEILL